MSLDAFALGASWNPSLAQPAHPQSTRASRRRGWVSAIAGTLSMLPLGSLFHFIVTDLAMDLEQAERERIGVEYIQQLYDLGWALDAFEASRAGTDTSGQVPARALEQRFQTLRADPAQLGAALGMGPLLADATAGWDRLADRSASRDHGRVATSALLGRLRGLIREAADRSGLTNDPALDLQYLQGIHTHALPTALHGVVEFRALGLSSSPPPDPTQEQAQQLAVLGSKLSAAGTALLDDVKRAAPGPLATDRKLVSAAQAVAAALTELAALTPCQRLPCSETRAGRAVPEAAYRSDAQSWMDAGARALDALKTMASLSSAALERGLSERIAALKAWRWQRLALAAALGVIAALSWYALYRIQHKGATLRDRELERIADEHRRGQQAILLLMDELGEVASGNLAARASVTSEITGSIADSINVTIEALREVVEGIDAASAQVNASSQRGRAVANALSVATTDQSERIKQTSGSIETMTQSITEVSEDAARCADVSMLSLGAAARGADAVREAIGNMDAMRAQIQETSKRIKRLGERSQEIGEIVSLIDSLAEQTNVLALNAAIQAVAAGDAGRGFAIVAEEVQRLAERSASATREVAARVKGIQSDTHDAVVAMEQSTHQVVEGTRLSIAVSQALLDIQNVTPRLASLVQSISVATQKQTEIAAQVSGEMSQILEINTKTTAGASQIVAALTTLADTVRKLRASVSRFRL